MVTFAHALHDEQYIIHNTRRTTASHDHPLLALTGAAEPQGKSSWVGKVLKLPKEIHPEGLEHKLTPSIFHLKIAALISDQNLE